MGGKRLRGNSIFIKQPYRPGIFTRDKVNEDGYGFEKYLFSDDFGYYPS